MPESQQLAKYLAVASGVLSIVIWQAFMTREQFFPAMQYLSTSKIAIAATGNFAFALGLCLYKLLVKVFLGQLRDAEIERINERISQALMETCLALTIFREEFNVEFCAMFTILTFIKVFHWLVSDRVEFLETTPANSRLQHLRMVAFMAVLLVIDAAFLQFTVGKVLQRSASVHLLFAFEYVIQASSVLSTAAKYTLTMIDAAMEGQWEGKGLYVFYLELTTDLLHLFVYLVFFVIVFANYGLPLHLVRDLYWTFRTFRNRVADFLRYRRVTAHMDQWFSDASEEQLVRADHTCIVCREDMTVSGRNKVLRCGHVFHLHCLRSWLERQQNCPTCRASVMPESAGTPDRTRLAEVAAGLHRLLEERRREQAALLNGGQPGNQDQQQRQGEGERDRGDGLRQRGSRRSGSNNTEPAVGTSGRRASRRRSEQHQGEGQEEGTAEESRQHQWEAWARYYQQLAVYQAAVMAAHQSQAQAHQTAQLLQYQAAAAATATAAAHHQRTHQQQATGLRAAGTTSTTTERPQQQPDLSRTTSAAAAAAAAAGGGGGGGASAAATANAAASEAQPAAAPVGNQPALVNHGVAAAAVRPPVQSAPSSSAPPQAPYLGQGCPSAFSLPPQGLLPSTVSEAQAPRLADGPPAPEALLGAWPGFGNGPYGYSGFAWNVPQWSPQTSMAMFAPAGYAPFPYAGQQNPGDLVPRLSGDYNQLTPMLPMALPPAVQALIPPPPTGASPQQIHNHHAAAAAAAAVAASVMAPYSHHLMAPPSLVPMGGRSEVQGSRGGAAARSDDGQAAVGVSPAAAVAAANAAAAAAAAAVMSAPSSGSMSIEALRRRQVGSLQTQLDGLGPLHDHVGSPTHVRGGRNKHGRGASLASPSFPPSIASSRGPSTSLDPISAPAPSDDPSGPSRRSFGDAAAAGGFSSDSSRGTGGHRSPASLSTVLSALVRATSQGTAASAPASASASASASVTVGRNVTPATTSPAPPLLPIGPPAPDGGSEIAPHRNPDQSPQPESSEDLRR